MPAFKRDKLGKSTLLIWLIVGFYLIVGGSYSFLMPLGESPDELDHFRFAQHLLLHRSLPYISPIAEENFTMEANQPPLYYSLVGGVIAGIPQNPLHLSQNSCFSFDMADAGRKNFYYHNNDEAFPFQNEQLAFHLARFVSLLMGAGTIWLTYWLGKTVAPNAQWVGLLSAAIVGWNPQFILIHTSVNNDALSSLMGVGLLAGMVTWQRGTSRRQVVGLGILWGLALLTKLGLMAFALPFAWVAWQKWRRKALDRIDAGIIVILPILIAGWWFWRNFSLYGDGLAWDVHLAAKGANVLRQTPFSMADLIEFTRLHFQSYWGLFGWLNLPLPVAPFLLLTSVAIFGWGYRIITKKGDYLQKKPLLLSFLAVIGVYLALFRYIQTINWSGYQGRLAYAAVAPMGLLMGIGIATWGKKIGGVIAGILAVSSLFGIWTLFTAYPRPAIYQSPPTDSKMICARVAAQLQIEAVVVPERVKVDEPLPITIYGYGLADATESVPMQVTLWGNDGTGLATEHVEGGWSAGIPFSQTITFTLPPTTLPTRATVGVGLFADDWLPMQTINGHPLPAPFPVASLKIAPSEPVIATPQMPAEIEFADGFRLLGYSATKQDTNLQLTLYWQATAPIQQDETFYVHLLDETGALVTQYDSQPLAGNYPTSIWDVGEVVADEILLPLPAILQANWELGIGGYLLPNGEPLAVIDSGVFPHENHRVRLPLSNINGE